MGEFILRNLFHRPLRTLIAVLAVAVEVTLVVIIVGLTSGLLTETAKRIEGVGADIMLQAPSSSVFLAFSGSPLRLAEHDGAVAVNDEVDFRSARNARVRMRNPPPATVTQHRVSHVTLSHVSASSIYTLASQSYTL